MVRRDPGMFAEFAPRSGVSPAVLQALRRHEAPPQPQRHHRWRLPGSRGEAAAFMARAQREAKRYSVWIKATVRRACSTGGRDGGVLSWPYDG